MLILAGFSHSSETLLGSQANLALLHVISHPPETDLLLVLLWKQKIKRNNGSVQAFLGSKLGTGSISLPSHSVGQSRSWVRSWCKGWGGEYSASFVWRSCKVTLQRDGWGMSSSVINLLPQQTSGCGIELDDL